MGSSVKPELANLYMESFEFKYILSSENPIEQTTSVLWDYIKETFTIRHGSWETLYLFLKRFWREAVYLSEDLMALPSSFTTATAIAGVPAMEEPWLVTGIIC